MDFAYEVSRSIAACEGCLLVVDATQGVQAQTISNLYMAIEHDLEIIPVLNKCDMANAMPEEVEDEIIELLGCKREEIIRASGKTGMGVDDILRAVVERIPCPTGDENAPLQALIFDSVFNSFRGIIAYFKIVNGSIRQGEQVEFINTKKKYTADEVGVLKMDLVPCKVLHCGDVGYIVSGIKTATEVKVGDNVISFKAPFKRVTILGAIKEKTGYDLDGKTEDEIRAICKELGLETVDETFGKGKMIDEIFGEFCEGSYIQPTFVTDYPVEMSPLTKKHRDNPALTERFELMVNGKELANAYSELNDPIDQEERFEEQLRLSQKGDDEAMYIDQDFLRAMQYGMPPMSGIGIGMDRLVMLMTGQTTIQEVLFFPQMRPEKKAPRDAASKYAELGIGEEWVPLLQKAGYNLVGDLKDANPQKVQQQLGEIIKKYKLEMVKPSVADVAAWIAKL